MSTYFDDASLVMIPSGYKDDKLYSIKPVEELDDELITNGGFDSDSDWTKGTGTTISGGTANFSSAGGVALYQDIGTQSGSVKVTFTISNYSSGTLNVYSGGNQSVSNVNVVGNANGFYSCYVNRSGGNANIIFGSSNNFTGSIDNVSVKEVITAAGDFTFSRDGSGASPATRVNSAGLIEKGRTNLLLQSNQFDTTWTNSSSTETSGQSGYDGTNDAWLLTASGVNAHIKNAQTTTGVMTLSCYMKKGTTDWARLSFFATNNPRAYFDLNNGVVGTTAFNIDANITDVGNGWYRCSITANVAATSSAAIFVASGDDALSTTNENIYIQDAQLEKGLVATSYIETTTAAASAGILGDMPRLDYSGGASCPSLLLEPQRTNLFTQSEYLDGFTTAGSPSPTRTANYAESPEGVDNAYRVEIPSVSGLSLMAQLVAHTSGTKMTISAYVKSNTGTDQSFKLFGDYGTGAGTSGNLTATSEWQRFTFTFTPTATGNRNAGIINVANTAADLLVYGMQIETGSYPTSYVPTYGSATARAGDDVSVENVSSFIGQTSGTILYDYVINDANEANDRNWFEVDDDAGLNRVLLYQLSGQNTIRAQVKHGGTDINLTTGSAISDNQRLKVAIKYISGDIKVYLNGSLYLSSTSTFSFSNNLNNIELNGGGRRLSADMKQLLVFPTALTDAECISLTTL